MNANEQKHRIRTNTYVSAPNQQCLLSPHLSMHRKYAADAGSPDRAPCM